MTNNSSLISLWLCANKRKNFLIIITKLRTWKAHHTKHRRPTRERLPLPATLHFNSTLKCGRCLGYLHPHNPRRRNVAVPAPVIVFSLAFSPRNLYYRGQKNNNNNNKEQNLISTVQKEKQYKKLK